MNASVSAHRWLFRHVADLNAAAYEAVQEFGPEFVPVFDFLTDILDEVAQSMVAAVNVGTPELSDDL